MPLVIVISAVFFNLMNGFVNGYYIGFIHGKSSHIAHWIPVLGLCIFTIGFMINQIADSKLIALRKQSNGYQIPRGWLFTYISCPNHFGEIIEWAGFALVAMNLPALSFAIWTFCNLAPRANNHHSWYNDFFEDYPKERKALIPFLW